MWAADVQNKVIHDLKSDHFSPPDEREALFCIAVTGKLN